MRHFLYTLRRLASSGGTTRRGSRMVPTARLGLEVLEGRDLPSTLGISYVVPPKYQDLQPVYHYVLPTLSLPSPTMLAGKSVSLGQLGMASNVYGALQIASMALQTDGSYNFQGLYQTALYHATDSQGHPAVVS